MRFLLDAQLPRALGAALRKTGHEALHTLDLPEGNRTSDQTISLLADQEGYIVVSKDSDFVVSLLLKGSPKQLLQISTGTLRIQNLKPCFSAISRRSRKPSGQDPMWRSTERP